jgi:hypothetical protein
LVFRRPPFIRHPGDTTTKSTEGTKEEDGSAGASPYHDEFETKVGEQIRVLGLVEGVSGETPDTARETRALPRKRVVEVWRPREDQRDRREEREW